jgi:hypothetical protein
LGEPRDPPSRVGGLLDVDLARTCGKDARIDDEGAVVARTRAPLPSVRALLPRKDARVEVEAARR